ncbi:MAG: HdeA/HdeB family chaperone [Deltaproteobacteria bacterium]|nr:HdeA/HdeB family chaperone [Deltaproteobacteria bacterium]
MRGFVFRTTLCGVALALAGCASHAKSAGSKPIDPTRLTCEEFVSLDESVQPRAIAWLEGYDRARRVTDEAVGEIEVDRQTDVVVLACKENPKVTLWDKIKAHFPGGSKKVAPTKLLCADYTSLSEDEQGEVAYWIDGYNRAKRVDAAAVQQVDFERDTAVIVQVCKDAPKESLWAKMKSHF